MDWQSALEPLVVSLAHRSEGEPLRLCSPCAGLLSDGRALDYLQIPHRHLRVFDIDPHLEGRRG
eukprot:15027281-Alexandrium_andersonii.AAC.1